MQRDDRVYLLDILISARRAISYANNVTWEEFERDEMRQDAIAHALEIIGEAAKRVTKPTKDMNLQIPWDMMIGLRNRLIHEYFRINLAAVWDVVEHDLPNLIRQIEPLVPPETNSPD
jgi:uncharacterized protein with HEPN domain